MAEASEVKTRHSISAHFLSVSHDSRRSTPVQMSCESSLGLTHTHTHTHTRTYTHHSQLCIQSFTNPPSHPCSNIKRKLQTAKLSMCWMQMQPITWQGSEIPSLSPPSTKLPLSLSPCHRNVTTLFHVIVWLCNDDRLASGVSTRQISEATHLLCLARAATPGSGTRYRCSSACAFVCIRVCTLWVLSRVLHYAPSPRMGLMGCEEKADEAHPEAAYNVSNTWSAMSLVGHIGSVPGPSVSLLTSKCILGISQRGFAYSKFLI